MVADGRRRTRRTRTRTMAHPFYETTGEIKKGPWKAEEDQVLINHVKKYGPRDWSSIRSKGLLQRTGKSCRLRWVNKLRPNLKSGVKFTAEEERTVIELQAQFGNKWAKIATYLSGRTDNDVKNFWSSRQKRLVRFLKTSVPSSSKSQKTTKEVRSAPMLNGVPSAEALKFSSLMKDDMMKPISCLSSHVGDSETLKMVPLPEFVYPPMLTYEHHLPFQFNYNYTETNPLVELQPHISFPTFPQLQPHLLPLPLESQEFATRLGDPNFLDVFEYACEPPFGASLLPIASSFVGTETSSQLAADEENNNVVGSRVFIDDFPSIDTFAEIEPLQSPSEWS